MSDVDDLKVLLTAVSDRMLAVRWAFYVGDHPKTYVTPKLRTTFRELADTFDENYCGLAINSRLSRLEVTGWAGPDADAAQEVWDRSRLPRRQSRLWRYATVHGSAALILDNEVEGEERFRINPATIAYGHPDPDDPDVLLWLGKAWHDGEAWRATIMYADRVVRWVNLRGRRQTDHLGYVVDESDEAAGNTIGQVPGVVFNPYDEGQPLIDAIMGLQNRINKLAANKFVAAEFGAFRQRVFFTRQDVAPGDLVQAPDHAIVLDPGDAEAATRVQELSVTDLGNYDAAKNSEVDALFTIATLPRHMRVNPGSPPSGDAIKADEGPFVEAIRDLQNQLGEALVEAMALLGLDAEPVWRDPTVHNEQQQAATVQAMTDAGVPLPLALQRYAGWAEEDTDVIGSQPTVNGDAVGAAMLAAFQAPGVPTA